MQREVKAVPRDAHPQLRIIRIGRMRKLFWAAIAALLLCFCYGYFIESTWVKTTELKIPSIGEHRFVFISDIHYHGDADYLRRIISTINDFNPEFVVYGGDLVESPQYLSDALALMRELKAPVYAVNGNHEYWGGIDQVALDSGLRATGGQLLKNSWVRFDQLAIIGLDDYYSGNPRIDGVFAETDTMIRIVCVHEPKGADLLSNNTFALALSGHSHGGQVRLPFIGALLLPGNVRPYQLGLYHLPGGPLYVSSGIGTWHLNVRFMCRPEIVTVTGHD